MGLKAPRRRWKFSLLRLFLFALNVVSTGLTLFAGLKENALIVAVTGKYDRLRERLRDGSVNTNIANSEVLQVDKLTPLEEIADTFRFITTPRREPRTIGSERSICLSVNSINTTVGTAMFDDYWGKGPRRLQVYYFSISAPNCKVINFKKGWRKNCIADRGGNVTACDDYILKNWDALAANRRIKAQAEGDFGENGTPFLKCLGRPFRVFPFLTDQVNQQIYWDGSPWHMSLQTSQCRALPRIQTDDLAYGLYEVEAVDEGCDALYGLPNPGWFTTVIASLYAIVSVTIIGGGLLAAIFRSRRVLYLPDERRYEREFRFLRYIFPFMPLATAITPNQTSVIHFKGEPIIASDYWINHWLYMWLSILDAMANIRLTYLAVQAGTWFLVLKVTFENFLFVCSAVAKVSWLVCLAHTILKWVLKSVARSLKTMGAIKSSHRKRFNHWIDGVSLFMNYKMYNIMLCSLMALMLKLMGTTTFMVRQHPYKVGNFGGFPSIGTFWHSELVCDITTFTLLELAAGFIIGSLFMCTKYKHIARNSVIRMLQRRYVIVGWDAILAADLLGMDVNDPDYLVDGVARTKCDVGTLLQLLYLSGPSSFVRLAGDDLFVGGFSKDPPSFRYTVRQANQMGLVPGRGETTIYTVPSEWNENQAKSGVTMHTTAHNEDGFEDFSRASSVRVYQMPPITTRTNSTMNSRSIFERRLVIVSEGYLKMVHILDQDDPPRLVKNDETGQRDFEIRDALNVVGILDIKPILTGEKKLRIC